MKPEEFAALVNEVRADIQREEEQALLQGDLSKAQMALAGKFACDRVIRKLAAKSSLAICYSKMSGRAK